MKKLIAAAIIVVSLLILIKASAFTVAEYEQVVITRFGDLKRAITEPGLGFRVPFIEKVERLEKRLIPWDGDPENMTTKDKKSIYIDVWARWRIVDPMKYFRRLRTIHRGQGVLDGLLDSAVRDVVARYNLIECVRSTNDPLFYSDETLEEGDDRRRERIVAGRSTLEDEMLATVNSQDLRATYGMEVTAVRLKRVNYVKTVRERVYERMKSERMRIAMLFESEAEEERNRILGNTRKELDFIEGDMQQQSAEIRGRADAEVITIYAESLSEDPEFFKFLRRLETYKKTLGSDTRLILSTDSELLELLKDSGAPPD